MSYWTLPGSILASFGWESTFIGIMFINVLKEFKPIVQVVLFLTLQVPDQIVILLIVNHTILIMLVQGI